MATHSELGGSPFHQEVWRERFGLGGSEFGVSVTIPRDDVPWSTRLDPRSLRILAELFDSLEAAERTELARLLKQAADNLPEIKERLCRSCGWVNPVHPTRELPES